MQPLGLTPGHAWYKPGVKNPKDQEEVIRRWWAHWAASKCCEDRKSSLPVLQQGTMATKATSTSLGDTTGGFLRKGISDAARGPASKC